MKIERLQIMLSEDELAALDDWRLAQRLPSRPAAVRALLSRGLAAEGSAPAKNQIKSPRNFGRIAGSTNVKRDRSDARSESGRAPSDRG